MVNRKIQFTKIFIHATLKTSSNDEEKALQLLEKAENNCLITNSLNAHRHLESDLSIIS